MKRLSSIVPVVLCGAGAFLVTVAMRAPARTSAPRLSASAAAHANTSPEASPQEPSEAAWLELPKGQVPPSELQPTDHKVCDFRVEAPPQDVLAETPLKTRAALAEYLAANAPAFNELRKAIVPTVFHETERVQRCWKDAGGSSKVELDVTFKLESDATRARADQFAVRATRGEERDVTLAQACLASSLLKQGFAVEANATSSPFARYSGTYPNVHHIVLQ